MKWRLRGGDRRGRAPEPASKTLAREPMSRRLGFAREKRLLLGALALVAPFPLPFNEAVSWGTYLLYAVAVVAYMVRAWRGAERWLPVWAANVLALAYLPFLGVDLFALSRGGLVGPVLHLGLFAVVVKLWTLRQERDKWHASLGIFFLFVAASATSVHISVVLYLAVFLGATLLLLARFALFHLLAGFGHRRADGVAGGVSGSVTGSVAGGVEVPLTGFVVLSVVLAVLLAVPLFAVLPRVNNPYISAVGRGFSTSAIGLSGFSDDVTLDTIGALRTSREVALRLTFADGVPDREIRLKGGAFDRLEGGNWRRAEPWEHFYGQAPNRVRLVDPAPAEEAEVEVWLQPLFARGLPLPVETVRLEVPVRGLRVNRGGAVSMVIRPSQPMRYRTWVASRPVSAAMVPSAQGTGEVPGELSGEGPGEGPQGGREDGAEATPSTLATDAVTPRIAELAARVAGEGGVGERARRLERHLLTEYDYTLELLGSRSENPLETFLFDTRRGHCEYFASALVMLLRAEGIHARLVTGFLGGDVSPLGYVIVRQANAHAWVEAWIPGQGWSIFDPTPPAGRPIIGEQTWGSLAGQVYDSVVFQWERYVLSYGVEDQMTFLYGGLRRVWSWIAFWRGGEEDAPPETAPVDAPEAAPVQMTPPADEPTTARWLAPAALGLLLAALLAVAAYLLWRHHRAGFTATRAYRSLRRHLDAHGMPLTAATGPLDLERRAARRWPTAAEPAATLMRLYLRESFGGRGLDEAERQVARDALQQARRIVRGGDAGGGLGHGAGGAVSGGEAAPSGEVG